MNDTDSQKLDTEKKRNHFQLVILYLVSAVFLFSVLAAPWDDAADGGQNGYVSYDTLYAPIWQPPVKHQGTTRRLRIECLLTEWAALGVFYALGIKLSMHLEMD